MRWQGLFEGKESIGKRGSGDQDDDDDDDDEEEEARVGTEHAPGSALRMRAATRRAADEWRPVVSTVPRCGARLDATTAGTSAGSRRGWSA